MSLIERELRKIETAMAAEQGDRHRELYAAQQALAWASDPYGFKPPFVMIMGTQEGSADCSAHPSPLPSLGACSQNG